MNTTRRILALGILIAYGLNAGAASAQELLGNPTLEALAPNLVGWTLEETVTGQPGAVVDSAAIVDFANQPMTLPNQTGLWLRGFAGNLAPFLNQNVAINAILSQTVPGAAGETYTLTGWSKWESNFSGAVDTLDALSPSGAIPSPTESIFEVAFLNASNAVIGTPVTFDLRTEQFGDNTWRQHTVPAAVAPAGTASVRVRALATDMLFNIDPMQSGFYDTFSLTAASAPATNVLNNGVLNFVTGDPVFTLAGNAVFNSQGFANHTPGGTVGAWFQSFNNGDATVTQTVDAVAGEDYTLSAWSKWEANYSGGQVGTGTNTLLELAFLDGSEAVIGTPLTLDLRTEQMNDAMWRQHTLMGTAPAGAAHVRVSGLATGMVSTSGAQGAFFDDFSLMTAAVGVPGDYNANGTVDAADYVAWRNGDSPDDTQAGYDLWKANFGRTAGAGSGNLLVNAAAVPEPTGCGLALIAIVAGYGTRRRWLATR